MNGVGAAPAPAPSDIAGYRNVTVANTSASLNPGESKSVSVSCPQSGDVLVEHRCLTDEKCGVLYDSGHAGKNGQLDMVSCGARNTCGKGTITILVSATCRHS